MTVSKNILIPIFGLLFFICCENLLHKDISMMTPVAFYEADELIDDLKNGKDFPKEQVIRVDGFIEEMNTKNNNFNILIKGYRNQNHYIICEMNNSFEVSNVALSKGNPIAIKGVLKGYLNDVILLNCVVDNILPNE